VIVTVSGWLYIVFSLLALVGFKTLHGASEKLAALASITFLFVVGVGLLRRLNWARWLTLGMSLLTWTLGSLVFFWQIVWFFRVSALFRHSFGPAMWVVFLIVVALCCAYIWLNFRLFEHLNSDDGRLEFDAPETETHAVAKSTALQIAWGLLSTLLLEPGLFGIGRSSNTDYAATIEALKRLESERSVPSRETVNASVERARDVERRRQANESALREAEQAELAAAREQQAATESMHRVVEQEEDRGRQRVAVANRTRAQEDFQRKIRELVDRRVRDRSYTDTQFETDRQALQRELERSWDTSAGTSPVAYSESSRQPSSASERTSSAILKCRDASGAVSFTQGYCPAGTTLVESPPTN